MENRFSNLVDISEIQQILVSFQAASGIMTRILDLDGRIIVSSSTENLLEEFHQFIQNRQQREEQILSQNNENLLRRYEYSGKLFQYAQVIRVKDRDMATLIVGPVFHESLNELENLWLNRERNKARDRPMAN